MSNITQVSQNQVIDVNSLYPALAVTDMSSPLLYADTDNLEREYLASMVNYNYYDDIRETIEHDNNEDFSEDLEEEFFYDNSLTIENSLNAYPIIQLA